MSSLRNGAVWVAAAAMMLGFATSHAATQDAPPKRFSLSGTATLTHDPAPLVSPNFVVRGQATSADAPASTAIVQDSARFALMAKLVAVTQVCYNDTIFRNDFDGDGG